MATAVAAGQAVDAGACRVRLTAALDRLAAGQIQTGKLRGFQRVNVAWQLVAIATAALVLWALTSVSAVTPALIASWALTTKTLLRAWTAWCAFDALTAWALTFALVAA
jgi:hypothetical protein